MINNMDKEWELSDSTYSTIIEELGPPEIDLFDNQKNAKCKLILSWFPDSEAFAIDAFVTISWTSFFFLRLPSIMQR